MRRTTAVFLLSLSVFIATPSDPANSYGDFGARIRAAIHRVVRHIASNADWITLPKP